MPMSTPKRTSFSLTFAIAAAWPMLGAAQPAADSAYRTDAQSTHVEDATSRGIQQVNMITCFLSSMRPDALVNQGPYNALVDQNKCDPGARSNASASSGAGSNAPSYMSAVVDVTRASNADPMRSKTWVTESIDGFESIIFINTSATAAPSGSNPYGVFRVDYCGKGSVGPCMMRGFLQGSASGIDYYEVEGGGMGGGGTKALTLTTSGTDAGAGRLQMNEQGQTAAYSFAYNANYFRRSDGNADQCFARDATDPETGMSVWSYGMYDADSGARVELNSGFPIDYTSNGTTYHGHIGYWGLWLPPEASAANGATVQRVQYSNGQAPTKTDYTLVKADGRLMKYTKRTRTLAAIDKIKFQSFVGDTTNFFAGATPFQQYEMYWDDAAGVFKVTGVVDCSGGNGCQTSNLPAEQSVSAAYFAPMGGARGWSQALGGELFVALAGNGGSVNSSAVEVIYRQQELVYPSQMPANLYCLRDCPTAASIAAYFAQGSNAQSPFVASSFNAWGPVQPADVLSYATDSNAALLRDANSAALTFIDRDALAARPQYQSGVRTGRLFTSLAAAVCPNDNTRYCDHQVELMDEYYQWETGPNQWNQFAAVKNSSGSIVQFDAPLQVNYSVPNGAAYGAYAGKSIVLQYGGMGQLWGIPGHCVSSLTNEMVSCDTQGSRYVPAFVIPYDETLGRVSRNGTNYLVKWLDREIRFARKVPATCAAAGLSLPSGLTLPTASGLADPSDPASSIYIGTKPTLTAAPRVIHGEVMY